MHVRGVHFRRKERSKERGRGEEEGEREREKVLLTKHTDTLHKQSVQVVPEYCQGIIPFSLYTQNTSIHQPEGVME